jgi:Eco57I restriction-modification methylase
LQNYIFNRKYLSERFKHFSKNDISHFEKRHKIIKNWHYSLSQSDLEKTKEISIQGDFLHQFFTLVLDYKGRIGEKIWNLQAEKTTDVDATTADGALGYFSSTISDTRVVIELKDARTELDRKQRRINNQSPIEQAFSYQYKHRNCKWVIVSNFKEIRLYNASTMTEYEQFFIEELANDEKEFVKFYYLLNKDNLIKRDNLSSIDELYVLNEVEQEKITEKFYDEYRNARLKLYLHLSKHNLNINEITLFEKTQKILDRFIFICFCEDSHLLPENIFRQVVQAAKVSFDLNETRIWNQLKGLFSSIDKGNNNLNINRFNGGLFKEDEILDSLIIQDDFFPLFEQLTSYDFDSELDVNLLGHIFEQSISDIEEFKAEIMGFDYDKNKSKRKKNGVFYTPTFVTQFIVKKTIGEWIENKRLELGEEQLEELTEDDFREYESKKRDKRKKKITNVERHIDFYTKLQDTIREIKIIDPACGSGAFLNAAFDFLFQIGNEVNKKLEELTGLTSLFDLDKHILKNNLFGVDLNQESVEITKLSLWLKTANKKDPLTSLDKNILCGNSVVNDMDYTDLPFNWETTFAEVIEAGGFDIVLGNPPYVRQELIVNIKPHLSKNYRTYHGRADLYVYFFEKALDILKPGGKIGYICSSKFTTTTYGLPLRNYLLSNSRIRYFMNFDDLDVFKGIVAYPSIFIADKEQDVIDQEIKYCHFEELDQALDAYFESNWRPFLQSKVRPDGWNFLEDDIQQLNEKVLKKYKTLQQVLGEPKAGFKTGKNSAFVLDSKTASELILIDSKNKDIIQPYLIGKNVKPYIATQKLFIIFPYIENKEKAELELIDIEDYPSIKNYLGKFKIELEKRAIIKDGLSKGTKKWYEYQQINKKFSFSQTYITYPDIANKSSFALSYGNVLDVTLFWVEAKDPYRELAILNSSAFNFLFNLISTDARGGYKRFKKTFMSRIPYIENTGTADLSQLVQSSIEQSKSVTTLEDTFGKFIYDSYNLKNSPIIEEWHSNSFETLIKEVRKQGIKLSKEEEFSLHKFISEKQNEILELRKRTILIYKEVDNKVFDLYGFTIDEKQLILNELIKN